MKNKTTAPFIHTKDTRASFAGDWLVAAAPIAVWSVYMFGARVITVCAVCALLSLALDYLSARFIFKLRGSAAIDLWAAVYGIFAAFMMPVAVPLWLPAVASVFVVFAKNLRIFRGKRAFNPFVFSAAALNIAFPSYMTAFTKPFAYFSAFDISLDPLLVKGYRVLSPLQYMADGSVYEDGIPAQFYGFASGNIGEIAIAAILLAAVWLFIRRSGDWRGTLSFLVPILLLGLIFPSSDAESNYFAFGVLFSGGAVFLSVFAANESGTLPITKLGRIIFGVVCGTVLFGLRKLGAGFEWGYFAVLLMNLLSPFIELITKPKALGHK